MNATVLILVSLFTVTTVSLAYSIFLYQRVAARFRKLQFRYTQIEKSNEILNQKLLQETFAIQEEERRRISMDLHDEIGSGLTSLKYNIQALFKQASFSCFQVIRDTPYSNVLATIDEIIMRSKEIVRDISPTILEQFGLVVSLEALFNRTNNTTYTVRAVLTTEGDPRELTVNQELMMYRIIQELLSNSMKYSNLWRFRVHIKWEADCVEMQIVDEARIGTEPNATGMGLANVQNRVLILGGTLEGKSNVIGSYITIRVPYEHRKN